MRNRRFLLVLLIGSFLCFFPSCLSSATPQASPVFQASLPSLSSPASTQALPSSSPFSAPGASQELELPASTSAFPSTAPLTPPPNTQASSSAKPPSSPDPSSIATTVVPSTVAPSTSVALSSGAPSTSVPDPSAPVLYPPCSRDHKRSVFLNKQERAQLDELLSSYGGSVSLYYYSPLNDEVYAYAPDSPYYAASLVKVPYVYYLLRLADRGECDLEQELELKEQWKQSGTGVLKNEPAGQLYTVRKLLEYMITVSDNTAFKILREEYSLWHYNKFCRQELDVQSITYETVTPEDMAKILKAVYRYIEGGSENALFLRDLMAQAISPLIKAPEADLLIHKHGWATPGFHDMAIVYQKHPYLLILMSDHSEGTKEDVKMFSALSRTIKAMQDEEETRYFFLPLLFPVLTD